MALEDAINDIIGELRTISGIRKVPDQPPSAFLKGHHRGSGPVAPLVCDNLGLAVLHNCHA